MAVGHDTEDVIKLQSWKPLSQVYISDLEVYPGDEALALESVGSCRYVMAPCI